MCEAHRALFVRYIKTHHYYYYLFNKMTNVSPNGGMIDFRSNIVSAMEASISDTIFEIQTLVGTVI